MNASMYKSVFAALVATVVLLGGQWASAANLPVWGGATTTNQPQPVQQPRQPLVSEPPPAPASTIQAPKPTTLSPYGTTGGSSPTSPNWSAPAQPQPAPRPTTRFQTAPSPVINPTGGRALGVSAPTQSTTGQSVPTGSTQPDVPAKKARFRATLTGFHVFGIEGVLSQGGLTYYVGAKVLEYSPWGAIVSHMFNKSMVVGNTKKYPGAIKGGTATNNGGFRNGDIYPTSPPYAASGAYEDRIPLVVWEGELTEGGNVVVIEPALWEKRGGESIFRLWHEQFPNKIDHLIPCTPDYVDKRSEGYPVPPWTQQDQAPIHSLLATVTAFGGSGVCVKITPEATFNVVGRSDPDMIPGLDPKVSDTGREWRNPHGIVLTYSKAFSMAEGKESGPVASVLYGLGTSYAKFPKDFVQRNGRGSGPFPVGGVQPFWFGTSPSDHGRSGPASVEIHQKNLGGTVSFLTATAARPIVPDQTAIELYLKVTKITP